MTLKQALSRDRDRHTYAVLRYGKRTTVTWYMDGTENETVELAMEFGALHGAIYIPLATGQKAVRMWEATAERGQQ